MLLLLAAGSLLKVHVLNGRTSKPVTNQQVILQIDPGTISRSAQTDGEGWLDLSQLLPQSSAAVRLYVDGFHIQCAPLPAVSFSLPQIRSTGLVSQNNCKPSVKASPIPGTLVLYVRDETFFEKMAR